MKKNSAILYYFHDPMCSWCWAFSTTFFQLCSHLSNNVRVKRILGGLAPDTDEAMPENLREMIKSGWSRIENTVEGIKFNFDFWEKCQPRRATYAACRAVIAARQQGKQYDELMTDAIQKAYYREARNPSDEQTLIELACETGLDKQRFLDDFYSEEVENELRKEIHFSREMYVESFPSLVLEKDNDFSIIKIDYNDYDVMLRQIEEKLGEID